MSRDTERPVTAVLGPTNTGKTHLAVERLCGHSSGMIGFPLRLLAREVYDRVVRIKGANQVALITGEEKIVPKDARWFLCTAESMPLDRDLAFVAVDEAQLGADPERGHVFTDRILRARGREETMILGSEALRPMLKALVPGIDILNRPRFSTLSYAGARKISRLPKRSAIVAFSAEEVYAVAEMLRRLRGGAAVVMGALSPRTRNAQVAMFQAGEVDYLVATDAIGMGLNMDVAHVAFASLDKFDGHRQRRLTVAEMAQIAGRAGRHQRDGTFGALVEQGPGAFTPEEVLAIEEHRFPRLDFLYWRDGAPDMSSIDALVESLEARPAERVLRAAPQSIDLAVLKRLAQEDWVRDRVRSPAMVARLWAAAGLPDFRKLGVDPHARFVGRLFGHLSEGHGHVPHSWFAEEIARLDNVAGDVETLAGRIASARSWAYIANRPDWLADPAHWAERTRAIEERLSDALHLGLTQRFVDKRTTMLLRQIGNDRGALPVVIGPEGEVMVEDHPIGRLDGFRFTVAADARHSDKRLLLAAAERRLGDERARRGEALAGAAEAALALDDSDRPAILWEGLRVAELRPGPTLVRPRVTLDRALDCLDRALQAKVRTRLETWLADQLVRRVPGLVALDETQRAPDATSSLRAVAAALVGGGGIIPRAGVAAAVDTLDPPARKQLRAIGVTIGALDLFDARLLKPGPARWRRMLIAARAGEAPGAGPPDGAAVLDHNAPGARLTDGFRPLGAQAVRVDLVDRIARAAHDARAGRKPFAPDPALATSIGVMPETLQRLMAALGFRTAPAQDGAPRWVWRGVVRAKAAPPPRDNAFAALAGLRTTHG
ncbi:MAG: helicase [Sphingomonas bacterium]|uniref:helicase-related protein n=1 Tax=Sphingomonas bacterium TaxID=1895847 RepID=UPI0026054393|nr:helicase-related protein [Sphingomonas bacterium]MDB5703750.1 helicase [Sphingomonas bacterium]